MFTNTADYISNKELSMGAADHWNKSVGSTYSTLYEDSVHSGPPDGYNVHGEPTSLYGGSDETDSEESEDHQSGGAHGESYIEGSDGRMGPNELNFDKRIGFADVETSSFENRSTMS